MVEEKPKVEKKPKAETKPNKVEKVVNGRVYVRKKPTFKGEIVRIAEVGEVLEVSKEEGKWSKVKDGYVYSKYLD